MYDIEELEFEGKNVADLVDLLESIIYGDDTLDYTGNDEDLEELDFNER